MEIKKAELQWRGRLYGFSQPVKYIILHHAAGNGSVKGIHEYHKNVNGWSGIGYHLYVRKNGEVWEGRPIDKTGAHCLGFNGCSVGICFEGDFSSERMEKTQREAGRAAIAYVRGIYPDAETLGHRELSATQCPGRYFPLEELKGGREMSGEEIARALEEHFADGKCPEWAEKELAEAVSLGITDGERPMEPTPRYQAAIMAMRAARAVSGEMESERG